MSRAENGTISREVVTYNRQRVLDIFTMLQLEVQANLPSNPPFFKREYSVLSLLYMSISEHCSQPFSDSPKSVEVRGGLVARSDLVL